MLLLLGPEGPGLRSELKNCCDRTLGPRLKGGRVDQLPLAHWFSYGRDRLINLIVGDFLVQVGWPSRTIPNIRSWDPGTYEWVYNTGRAAGKLYTGDKDDQKEGQLEMNKNLKKKQKMNGNFVRVVEIPSVFFVFWVCFGDSGWGNYFFAGGKHGDLMNFPELNATIGMSDPTPGKRSVPKLTKTFFFSGTEILNPWGIHGTNSMFTYMNQRMVDFGMAN